LWEIRLSVFCKKKHLPHVKDVKKDTEATGIGRVFGNKGGTIIHFSLYHSTFCFVNSHLAAHQNMTEARNLDVFEITTQARNGIKFGDISTAFNVVFWMGDLNYRIAYGDQKDDRKPSFEMFNSMCKVVIDKKFDVLYAKDQLKAEMEKKMVFSDWQEGFPRFQPTFKVKRNEKLIYNVCQRFLSKF
jgi:hypothetical protein